MKIHGIQAVIFDMDGTLVVSEGHTRTVVCDFLESYGLSVSGIDCGSFRGRTWRSAAQDLGARFSELKGVDIAKELHMRFEPLFRSGSSPLIPGAEAFVHRCADGLKTAITTSSDRESLRYLVQRMGLDGRLAAQISAQDYKSSKPDPECYLLTAERLGVPPRRCLVFEDSEPGLRAAKSAGMWVVAVTHDFPDISFQTSLADRVIIDFGELGSEFLTEVLS